MPPKEELPAIYKCIYILLYILLFAQRGKLQIRCRILFAQIVIRIFCAGEQGPTINIESVLKLQTQGD